MYRTKIRISKALHPGFEQVKKKNILKERYVNADEIWWPIVEPEDVKKDIDTKEQPKVSSGKGNAKGGIDTKEQPKVSSGKGNAKGGIDTKEQPKVSSGKGNAKGGIDTKEQPKVSSGKGNAKGGIDTKEQQKVSSGNDNAKGGIDTKEQQKVSSGNDNAKKDPKNKRKSKSSGFVIIVRGQKFCLAIVSKTRKITKLKEILPDYKGIMVGAPLQGDQLTTKSFWLCLGGRYNDQETMDC